MNNKTSLFEDYSIPKAVAVLSLPTVLSTLVMVLYNIADTYFVGMLNDTVESSAVTLAAPALLAFNAVNNLFGVGSASMISRCLGKKDLKTASECSVFSFWCAAVCAVCISVAYFSFSGFFLKILGADGSTLKATGEYLFWTVTLGAAPAILNVVLSNMVRSEGSSAIAGIGVMSGCVLNIILDPFFVLPEFMGMGASGAGCATFISNSFACLFFFAAVFIKRKETVICLNPKKFGFRKEIVREVFGVGLPASVQNLLNVTGTVILNNFTAPFGAASVAAIGIAHKINMIPMYICMGITQGVMPLVGYNYSSGNRGRMKNAIVFVAGISVVLELIMSAVLFVCSPQVVRMFMDNPDVVSIGGKLLREMCIGIVFLGTDFLAVGIFQATGKGLYSFIFAILRKLVLEIPALIILNKVYPLYGMGYAAVFSEVILAAAAVVMLKKIVSEKKPLCAGDHK